VIARNNAVIERSRYLLRCASLFLCRFSVAGMTGLFTG
jgi:hypothetical protein